MRELSYYGIATLAKYLENFKVIFLQTNHPNESNDHFYEKLKMIRKAKEDF